MQAVSRRISSVFVTTPFLVAAAFLLIVGLYYKQRDLAVVTLLILAIGGIAKSWTTLGRRGLGLRPTVDRQRVFPGNTTRFSVAVDNATRLPLWFQTVIPLNGLSGKNAGEDGSELVGESSLLWRDSATLAWEITAPARGVFRPGPVRLTCGDLFGFFPRESAVVSPVEIIVYPRLVPLRPFAIMRRDFFGIPGDESPVRDPVYILGTHDYQFGRPARFIHWKASARRHVLQEKVFEPTEQEKVLFVVSVESFERSGASAEFERTLEAVASLAALLDKEGIASGLLTDAAMTGKDLFFRPVKKDPGHLSSVLESLARMRMERGRDLLDTLRLRRALPFGVTCLCFSHNRDEASRKVDEFFARRRIPVTHFLSAPVDGTSPRGIRNGACHLNDLIFLNEGTDENP